MWRYILIANLLRDLSTSCKDLASCEEVSSFLTRLGLWSLSFLADLLCGNRGLEPLR